MTEGGRHSNENRTDSIISYTFVNLYFCSLNIFQICMWLEKIEIKIASFSCAVFHEYLCALFSRKEGNERARIRMLCNSFAEACNRVIVNTCA